MDFKKNRYTIIRKAISKDLALFLYNYFSIKKQVYDTCIEARYMSPFENMFGQRGDKQLDNTYSHYADVAMETLLLKCQPVMEKSTGLKLQPAYTYARMYQKGDILKRHKDRFSCEISTTMNLGGDDWPIFIEAKKNIGKPNGKKITSSSNNKGVSVLLKPGDMLVYRGCDLEHWREKFEGNECCQVFLHYNDTKTKGSELNLFDKRPHLGLPSWFASRKKQ